MLLTKVSYTAILGKGVIYVYKIYDASFFPVCSVE